MNADEAKQLSKRDTFKAIFHQGEWINLTLSLGDKFWKQRGFA